MRNKLHKNVRLGKKIEKNGDFQVKYTHVLDDIKRTENNQHE
jgi:hypothetical protein